MNLVEQSGYSYSGICDIVNEGGTSEFLSQLEKQYQEAIKEQDRLLKELDRIKSERGHLVSCFVYAHKALNLGDKHLSFIDGDKVIVVAVKDANKHIIDHESIEITCKDINLIG